MAPLTLLRVDAGAALVAGLVVLAAAEWLAALHGLPQGLVRALGFVNLAYATYSGRLAWRLARGIAPSRRAVLGLVVGNAAWAVACVAIAATHHAAMGASGFVHVLGEGAFVAGLAALERRWVWPIARSGG